MSRSQNRAVDSWAKVLNPHTLRSNLIVSSLFIVAFETLKDAIIGHLKSFFMVELDPDGSFATKYRDAVLSRHKSPLRASLLWFHEMRAIDDEDLETVDRIREHRNEIAHDLPALIAHSNREIKIELIKDVWELVCKIDRWWVREIELPTNPAFDGQEIEAIPDSEISSGRMIFLSMLFEIATGDLEEAEKTYEEFVHGAEGMLRAGAGATS